MADQSQLATCPGGFCAPDSITQSGGEGVPPTCTSIAGAEGRCLNDAIPQVAAEASQLTQSTCQVFEKCVPCFSPIDGTKTFVRRVPLWGTLVALVEGDDVLAGAAFFPAVDELVVAARGGGCLWNGEPAHVSEVARLSEATVLATDERFARNGTQRARWSRLVEEAAQARTWGDCYGYLLVATGRAEVMVDGLMAPWDAAALKPIIEEAGGVFSDWRGRATAFGGDTIATNCALSPAVRTLLVDDGR